VVGVERGFITREKGRLDDHQDRTYLKRRVIMGWSIMRGHTGKLPFDMFDNAGDLVETAFLAGDEAALDTNHYGP